MARSQETFSKKEKEKKKLRKRKEKQEKREERKAQATSGALEDMIAYVDEEGNIVDTPPDPTKKKKVKAENIELGVPKREDEEPAERRGRVAFFNESKGYGFIMEMETQERYFVHINGLTEPIKENNMVTFELERGPKGMNAVRVKKI